MESYSFSKEEVEKIKKDAVRGRKYHSRISLILAGRLLGFTDDDIDAFSIIDELDYLEGIKKYSKTKTEQQFKHPPLNIFSHKHFTSARHVLKNIMVRWSLDRNGNKDLDNLIEKIAKNYGSNPELWQAQLAHEMVINGFEQRQEQGLTGDWIIYSCYDGLNYYLDLATHTEGKNPEKLYNKIKNGTYAEFSFIYNKIA